LNNNKLINEKLICAFHWSVLPSIMKMHGPKNKTKFIYPIYNHNWKNISTTSTRKSSSFQTVCSMSACNLLTAISRHLSKLRSKRRKCITTAHRTSEKKTLRISWSIGATIYSYLKCILYDKLLKPRQSFLITLYI